MLHYECIEPATLELLKKLMQLKELSGYKLSGGTALALHLGHRQSVDLDLFGNDLLDSFLPAEHDSLFKEVKILKQSERIRSYLIDHIKVDVITYSYKWLEVIPEVDYLRLASMKDIAAMKLAAVTGRGSRKDFTDLYFLLDIFTLQEMLDFYGQKYPDGSAFMVLKSLSFFGDADTEPPLRMMSKLSWSNIKTRILENVRKISQQ